MTPEQQQDICDRALRRIALQKGSTTRRDFMVIEIVLDELARNEPRQSEEEHAFYETVSAATRSDSVVAEGVTAGETALQALCEKWRHPCASLSRYECADDLELAIRAR